MTQDPNRLPPPQLVEHLCVVVEGLGQGAAWGEAADAALGVPGVRRVFVSHPLETMYLTYDPSITTAAAVRDALSCAGLHLRTERDVAPRRRG